MSGHEELVMLEELLEDGVIPRILGTHGELGLGDTRHSSSDLGMRRDDDLVEDVLESSTGGRVYDVGSKFTGTNVGL